MRRRRSKNQEVGCLGLLLMAGFCLYAINALFPKNESANHLSESAPTPTPEAQNTPESTPTPRLDIRKIEPIWSKIPVDAGVDGEERIVANIAVQILSVTPWPDDLSKPSEAGYRDGKAALAVFRDRDAFYFGRPHPVSIRRPARLKEEVRDLVMKDMWASMRGRYADPPVSDYRYDKYLKGFLEAFNRP
jgi:hypothetical protein